MIIAARPAWARAAQRRPGQPQWGDLPWWAARRCQRAEAQTREERRAETQEKHEWKTPKYSSGTLIIEIFYMVWCMVYTILWYIYHVYYIVRYIHGIYHTYTLYIKMCFCFSFLYSIAGNLYNLKAMYTPEIFFKAYSSFKCCKHESMVYTWYIPDIYMVYTIHIPGLVFCKFCQLTNKQGM